MQKGEIAKGLYVNKTYRQSQEKCLSGEYMKRWIVRLAVNNPENYLQNPPKWVKWVHNPTGLVHCVTCLKLNGCWFIDNNRPE